jgi:hypothetical protein
MDFDEALEWVTEGRVVSRPGWRATDVIVSYKVIAPNGAEVTCWRTTRELSLIDTTADDWYIIGTLH